MLIKTVTITYLSEDLARPYQNDPFSFSSIVHNHKEPAQPPLEALKYFEKTIGLERKNASAMCSMLLVEDFDALLEMDYKIQVSYENVLPVE